MAKVIPFAKDFVMEEYHLNSKTKSGLVYPNQQMPHNVGTFIGVVVSTGKDVEYVKVGDILVTHRGKLKQLPLFDKVYWICKSEDICAQIELEENDIKEDISTEKSPIIH